MEKQGRIDTKIAPDLLDKLTLTGLGQRCGLPGEREAWRHDVLARLLWRDMVASMLDAAHERVCTEEFRQAYPEGVLIRWECHVGPPDEVTNGRKMLTYDALMELSTSAEVVKQKGMAAIAAMDKEN